MTRFLPGLVCLCLLAASGRAAHPPASSTPNRVEPLSLPLRLSMTASEVLAALGPPRSDYRAFGGGLVYGGLRVMFDATGKEIGNLTIEGEARLASGIGVGTALSRVQAEFPGGQMVYDSYDVTAGPYALSFRAPAGTVDRIVIRPADRAFPTLHPAAPAAPAAPPPSLGALAGRWIDPRNAQSFEIFPDGRYRTGVGGEGRVSVSAEGLVFSGVLSAWDRGRARLTNERQVIEFEWRNADGSRNQFAFLRAGANAATKPAPEARVGTELRALAGRWIHQSIRNDYDNGAFDRGAGEDPTPLILLENGTWRYGNQTGKVMISDASPADLAFMDFKPTAKPEHLPRRKFELQGWAGDRALGFWRTDPADGQPYRVLLHFRIREPRPGLATWIRSRAPN